MIRHVLTSITGDPLGGIDTVDAIVVIVRRPAGVGDTIDVGSDAVDMSSVPDVPDVPDVSGLPGDSGDTVVPDCGDDPDVGETFVGVDGETVGVVGADGCGGVDDEWPSELGVVGDELLPSVLTLQMALTTNITYL